MPKEDIPSTVERGLATRSGSSRKLLTRKAREKAANEPLGEPVEASFPGTHPLQEDAQEPHRRASSAAAHAPAQPAAQPAAWSDEDEAALQRLLARRKAAGYQRRGRDTAGQKLRPGTIAPNPGTVVATIVAIVAEAGALTRAELLGRMASTRFPHPKAQPQDKGWCQGYVAGTIRSGFLAVDSEASLAPAEGA